VTVGGKYSTIDHLLYEINSALWRWVTGGRGNALVLPAPGHGPDGFLAWPTICPTSPHRADWAAPIEFDLIHLRFLLIA
jgi:hypothetical protein